MQSFALSDDMKPQIKTVIEAEFAKVGYDPQAAALKAAQNASNGSVASAVSKIIENIWRDRGYEYATARVRPFHAKICAIS